MNHRKYLFIHLSLLFCLRREIIKWSGQSITPFVNFLTRCSFFRGSVLFYWSVGSRQSNVPSSMRKMRIHIILRRRNDLSGLLLSIHTFYSMQWFWQRTAKTLIRLSDLGLRYTRMPRRHVFARRGSINRFTQQGAIPEDDLLWSTNDYYYIHQNSPDYWDS